MALSMEKATVAVSKEGIAKLKTDITRRVDEAKAIANENNEKYKALVNDLDIYWIGKDKDKFVSDLKTAVDKVSASIDDVDDKMKTALDRYMKNFETMQKNSTYKSVKI